MSPESSNEPGRRGRHSLALLVLSVIVVAAAGGWFWRSRVSASAGTGKARVRSVLHLDTFVLNLAGADERAYLRVGVDLGLKSDQTSKDSAAGVPVALVRDTILGVLATARPEELLTTQGKQTLKANLLRALRERIPELDVEDVYFTEFLIQR